MQYEKKGEIIMSTTNIPNQKYIKIIKDKDEPESNIPGFKFSKAYISGKRRNDPNHINSVNAVFISGNKEIKRETAEDEKPDTMISLARLAIQVYESDLDKLTEQERHSIKAGETGKTIGIWTDKDAMRKAFSAPLDGHIHNAYPSKTHAKYYFYNTGLFESVCLAQSLLNLFGKPGDYFIVYVTQGAKNENKDPKNDRQNTTETTDTIKAYNSNETNLPTAFIGGENVIFYGVPGCGKSFSIEDRTKETSGGGKPEEIRIVFHPDYTYSDFVGQILPKLKGDKVVYEFFPGPFTKALEIAKSKPNIPVFLIIEEINRGNAAAIFGDVFQLLDRDKNGESAYDIDNSEIAEYIVKNGNNPYNKVKIPSNLFIYATMNTSDQNVFTLDTAFQRRFDMELVRNTFGEKQDWEIPETNITWKTFAERVNKILANQDSVMGSEDKSLGAWFVKKGITKLHFANKVLKYLWDDAFKFDRAAFFSEKYNTLQEILDEFAERGFERILADTLQDIKTEITNNKAQSGGDDNATDVN
jgi:hypothetical protein